MFPDSSGAYQNLFYDMHDGMLLACNWTADATRLEVIILFPPGNMLASRLTPQHAFLA